MIRTPSGTSAPWDPAVTPYMVEPMRCLTSRQYEAVVFIGPAQSGKTQALVDCWVGWQILYDPSDMLILQTSQETARDFSRRRIDRLHRNSPALAQALPASPQNDNTYDKVYRSGNILSIGWPSINQLSGRPIKYMALTDYDRMPQDVDGEGSPFELSRKRTTTFLSRAMTMVESSPGEPIIDPTWYPRTPHEGPPARGIMALFNLGDRRRWYWPCQHCGEMFMQPPGIDGLSFERRTDKHGNVSTATGAVGVPCPACGGISGAKDKRAMVAAGEWRAEPGREDSRIASFWLPGAAATYISWRSTALRYLDALRIFEMTGSEESLKNVTNLDLGSPYLPRAMATQQSADEYKTRAEDLPKRQVPEGVRFLVAAVDVQKSRFVVQVHGFGSGLESWIVDRFDLHLSETRTDRGEPVAINPATRLEDWYQIIPRVVEAAYPLSDDSGRSMAVMVACCDSGGADGVTRRAYDFWRAASRRGFGGRLLLVKGERPSSSARRPRVQKSFPDSSRRRDRNAGARGDVPVYLLNTTAIKDAIHNDLARTSPGPGYVHFPDWLPPSFYDELAAESRGPKGWEAVRRDRANEALDLLGYAHAMAVVLGAEAINWDRPPPWAQPWDKNSNVTGGEAPAKEPEPAPASRRQKRGFVGGWR